MGLSKPNSTSWTKETAPKGKGARKNKKTIIKEAIGLSGWERLEDFLLNEGADKLCDNILQLKPKEYVMAYEKLSEFIKPKLSRATVVGEKDNPVSIQIVKTYANDNNPDSEANKSV